MALRDDPKGLAKLGNCCGNIVFRHVSLGGLTEKHTFQKENLRL